MGCAQRLRDPNLDDACEDRITRLLDKLRRAAPAYGSAEGNHAGLQTQSWPNAWKVAVDALLSRPPGPLVLAIMGRVWQRVVAHRRRGFSGNNRPRACI